jgi:hypothetical protein
VEIIGAIDPGEDTGWAWFGDGMLVECGLNGDLGLSNAVDGCEVTIERPRYYPRSTKRVDPNDLITLAITAGQLGCRAVDVGAHVAWVFPQEWKGSVPKDIHNRRVLGQLRYGETLIYTNATKTIPKSKHNNVIDAIGIGLWRLDRT